MNALNWRSPLVLWTTALALPLLITVAIQALMYEFDLFSTNVLIISAFALLPSYIVLFLSENSRAKHIVLFTALLIAYLPILAFPYFLYTACAIFKECHLL
ncbi:MAG: hypothetical protein ABW127_00150 [Candidatus Thiodiazotropha endolucinida]